MATERFPQGPAREDGDKSATAVTEAPASSAPPDHRSGAGGAASAAEAGSEHPAVAVSTTTSSSVSATEKEAAARTNTGPDTEAVDGVAEQDVAEAYETTHVHQVYEAIAPHFSATRYKPWPVVASFLLSQEPGSLGLDVGCGNGKYLMVNPRVHMLASDRSPSLVRLAREFVSGTGEAAKAAGVVVAAPSQGEEEANGSSSRHSASSSDLLVADSLALPFRPASVDFAISIAVIHHMSTQERRRTAIADILRCVRPGGRVLLYVWALEQASSRRGWDQGSTQDTLVPWVLRAPKSSKPAKQQQQPSPVSDSNAAGPTTFQRYYHLFREGELQDDVHAVGGAVIDAGYDRDNWWVVCTTPT